LVGKTEGLHLKGLLKEGIIEKELAKYTQTTLQQQQMTT